MVMYVDFRHGGLNHQTQRRLRGSNRSITHERLIAEAGLVERQAQYMSMYSLMGALSLVLFLMSPSVGCRVPILSCCVPASRPCMSIQHVLCMTRERRAKDEG